MVPPRYFHRTKQGGLSCNLAVLNCLCSINRNAAYGHAVGNTDVYRHAVGDADVYIHVVGDADSFFELAIMLHIATLSFL